MNKLWGLLVLGCCNATAYAQADDAPLMCEATQQTRVWQPLAGLEPGMIDIRADDVALLGTQSAEFTGHVDINTQNMSLSAQSALIDKQQGLLDATGPIVFRDKLSHISSSGLNANLSESEFNLLGADYQLNQQQGRGSAEKLAVNRSRLLLENASFTTCPVGAETWSIEASEILLSQEDGWGESYGMVLNILDTPVLYLPYFTFPLSDQRKSGFLAPKFSSSDRYGLEIIAPYYFNIAPNFDATLTPRYMSNKGLQLQGEVRYLTEATSGLIGAEFLGSDDADPTLGERYLFHWQQQSYLDDKWRLGIDMTNISDDNYLTDLESGYANRTDTQLSRSARLTYLGERWMADFRLQNFEVLGEHLEAYEALPQIGFSQREAYHLGPVDFAIDGELSHFRNDTLAINTATRLHLAPKLSLGVEDNAWSLLAEASLLHTRYRQEGELQQTQYKEKVNRTLPKLRLYSQLNFERDTTWLVRDGIQTLEPQIQYLYTPNKDQSTIGLFDTTKLQDDFFGLFRENRYSGVDRIAAANQLTVGATTRVLDQRNEEVFNFSAGQIFYLSNAAKPSVQALAQDTNYNALFAAEAMYHWHRRWYLSGGIQYDTDGKQVIQSHLTLDYKGDNKELVQLNHRYANDVSGNTIEQIGMFSSVPINQNWQFVASYHRDLTTNRSVEVFGGLQYESCCWAFQISGHRQIETDLNQAIGQQQAVFDSSIRVNFVLKGLGGKSSYDAQKLLQQGIFGYRRPYFLTN